MLCLLILAAAVQEPPAAVPAASAPAPAAAPIFDTAAPLDPGTLAMETAREDLQQISTSEQTSRVSGNTINGNSITGGVTIDGNAFQNMQGLTIITANSGNNVSVNAALNVNLSFSPQQ